MNLARFAAPIVLMLTAACGKVGPPLPPIVRTPQSVSDLRVTQNAHQVTLSWTNPARYVDDNAATDLAEVRILRNGVAIASEPVKAAGQPQSYTLDVSGSLDVDLTFAVQVVTQRGRTSAASNDFAIRPLEAPGAPRALTAVVDQLRINLNWEPPERNPGLVERYLIQRSDWTTPREEQTTHFEDSEYEENANYTYTVTAVRGAGERSIPGPPSEPRMVTATDITPPARPTGLRIESLEKGVLLQWNASQERDLKEYLVFRSDQTSPIATLRPEGHVDPDYRPGLSYHLAAEDVSGNRSERTMPQAGP